MQRLDDPSVDYRVTSVQSTNHSLVIRFPLINSCILLSRVNKIRNYNKIDTELIT